VYSPQATDLENSPESTEALNAKKTFAIQPPTAPRSLRQNISPPALRRSDTWHGERSARGSVGREHHPRSFMDETTSGRRDNTGYDSYRPLPNHQQINMREVDRARPRERSGGYERGRQYNDPQRGAPHDTQLIQARSFGSLSSSDAIQHKATSMYARSEALRSSARDFVTADRYKQITCPNGAGCRYMEDHCMFSHRDTGRYAPGARSRAKDFTCPDWQARSCRWLERECLYAHVDTGLYVGSDGKASTKHLTCWNWRYRSCQFGERCLFSHHDTGLCAWQPLGMSKGPHATHSLKDFRCPRYNDDKPCAFDRTKTCPYTHSRSAKLWSSLASIEQPHEPTTWGVSSRSGGSKMASLEQPRGPGGSAQTTNIRARDGTEAGDHAHAATASRLRDIAGANHLERSARVEDGRGVKDCDTSVQQSEVTRDPRRARVAHQSHLVKTSADRLPLTPPTTDGDFCIESIEQAGDLEHELRPQPNGGSSPKPHRRDTTNHTSDDFTSAESTGTTSSRDKKVCRACRMPGTTISQLVPCKSCHKGYHDHCGNPKPRQR
jgi:hypothetical protein